MSKADILAKLVSTGTALADGTLATVADTGAFADLLSKPTTLSGYGIVDGQPLDADLTAIAGLAGTSGYLRKSAANTWALDTTLTVDGTNPVGYLEIPQNVKSGAYTLTLGDSGEQITKTGTTAFTVTIPAFVSVPFPVGTVITFVNNAASGNLTIAITTDTLRLAGSATTGSRTLGAYGIATAVKVDTAVWMISGAGLT